MNLALCRIERIILIPSQEKKFNHIWYTCSNQPVPFTEGVKKEDLMRFTFSRNVDNSTREECFAICNVIRKVITTTFG